jgi:hypothetical protein
VTELAFERPGAAWALLLPLAFLLCLRLWARPPEVVIGTLELWDELPGSPPRGARARRRLPPWALVCALGLLFGALAWLGPRPARAASVREWTALVDLSPSLHLPHGAGTRLDAALASAGDWLARASTRGDRVRWRAGGRELVSSRAERPPAVWFLPRVEGEPEPEWALHDAPGTLWITDREPATRRAHAGLFTSGGAAVEGALAADGRVELRWERGELQLATLSTRPALLVRAASGRALPAVLERVLAAWCEARGFELVRAPRAGTRLVVEHVPGDAAAVELARDGWNATGRGGLPADERTDAPAVETAGFEDWLAGTGVDGVRHVLVRARRGLVQVGLEQLSEPRGDPAQFALSWARLLERALLAPEGVVPLAERLEAGEARAEPGAAPLAAGGGSGPGPRLDAGLALAAGLCALAALGLRPGARPGG